MRKSEFDDFAPEDGFYEDAGDEASFENEPEGEDFDGDGEFSDDEGYPGDGYYPEDESDEYTEADFCETDDGYADGSDDPEGDGVNGGGNDDGGRKKGMPLAAKIGLIFLGAVILFAVWALGTNSGRSFCMGFVARFVKQNAGLNDPDTDEIIGSSAIPTDEVPNGTIGFDNNGDIKIIDNNGNEVADTFIDPRSEDYVTTYLIFGLEQINGAANTDAIMLVSINTKDNTIKMTSLLRDTYVNIPGWDKNKLNSAYAKGAHGAETGAEARARGAALLAKTIEQTYDIKISGYASVNFSSFEKIVDRLGGLDIELGEKEAKYLNTTNYISNPEYRNVVPGWNHLNGNQVMGYVRVRKEETLGGSNNDYGRTVRQRRVISAIVSKYKSTKLTDLFSLTKDLIGYVNTNLTEKQIQDALAMIVNNGIYTTKSFRVPYGETFSDSGEAGIYNGSKYVTWTLVMNEEQLQDNIKALHRFIFLDPEEP